MRYLGRGPPCGPDPRRHDDRRHLQGPGARRRRSRPDARPPDHPARARALRRAVRVAHAGHEVLGDARPDGDHRAARGHLAGRRPAGHQHLPRRARSPPSCSGSPRERLARALQYGPTEGLDEVKDCIAEVMAAEGMRVDGDDLLVTTGGQQVIDLMCKTLVDPGDVVIAEAPTYPGAVPTFCSYQADVVQIEMDDDGMRIDVLEADARPARPPRAAAEVHLHGPELPEPGRRDDVAGAAAAPRGDRARRASCWCSRTTRTACCASRASRCRRCARWTAASTSSTSARSRRSSPPGCAWAGPPRRGPVLAKMNLGKQAADLCSSSLTQHFVAGYFEDGRLAALPRRSDRHLPAPARRDARGAGGAPPARGDVDAAAGRPVHLGHAAGLPRHDRPAGPRAARERGVRPRPRRRSSTAAAGRRCG